MISSNYPVNSEIARLTARMLLEVKAVHFNSKNPFTLASGLPSPTYIDCRKLISYPRVRSTIMDFLTVTVMRNVGFEAEGTDRAMVCGSLDLNSDLKKILEGFGLKEGANSDPAHYVVEKAFVG